MMSEPERATDGLQPHDLAVILPEMTEAEYAGLRDDIRGHGIREPLWVTGDKILDGRHRWKVARELGIASVPVREYGGDPVALVASLNVHRRHLSVQQRAMFAAHLANLPRGNPEPTGNNQYQVNPSADGITSRTRPAPTAKEAADLMNVSTGSVERARRVLKQAIPEVKEAVLNSTIGVWRGKELSDLPPDEQREELARIRSTGTMSLNRVKAEKRKAPPATAAEKHRQRSAETRQAIRALNKSLDILGDCVGLVRGDLQQLYGRLCRLLEVQR